LGMFIVTVRRWGIALVFMLASSARAAGVPDDCSQLIVGIAPDWNSMRGHIQLFEQSGKSEWRPVGQPFPVLFGKSGLAWGSGLAGQDEAGLRKEERDGRAPAGVFRIGKIYTYDAQLPPGGDYNRFVTIADPVKPPPWFQKAKMRHNDFAYRWLVEIRHNSDPPVPGAGSAIFFHIRRGVDRPTAGCTTMAEPDLVRIITWLRAARHPCYALLPSAVYEEKRKAWGLPVLPSP